MTISLAGSQQFETPHISRFFNNDDAEYREVGSGLPSERVDEKRYALRLNPPVFEVGQVPSLLGAALAGRKTQARIVSEAKSRSPEGSFKSSMRKT